MGSSIMGIWYTVDVSKIEIYLLFVVWFIANVKKREMFLSHPVWKLLFHTPTKRQNSYSQLTILSLTILITKHFFYSYFHSLYSQQHRW